MDKNYLIYEIEELEKQLAQAKAQGDRSWATCLEWKIEARKRRLNPKEDYSFGGGIRIMR